MSRILRSLKDCKRSVGLFEASRIWIAQLLMTVGFIWQDSDRSPIKRVSYVAYPGRDR